MDIERLAKEENKYIEEVQRVRSYLSNTFKLWIVTIIFFLTFFHLYAVGVYPAAKVISNEIILSVVLVLITYLWIQELRSKYRLQSLNKILTQIKDQLEHAEVDTVSVLILAEEAKDPYMRGHSKRVAEYSLTMAKEMSFSKERQRIIRRAGILHDLGKVGVVDNVLNKPGKLSDEEWKIMRSHPKRAVDILKPLKFLSREKEIILHHHERVDGGGYPDGLKRNEISIEARIMAVADTFDAMNSERPYRKPLSRDVVVSELKRVSGIQLDSSVVKVFLRLLEKNPSLWERD